MTILLMRIIYLWKNIKMKNKFLEWENKIFSAPYKWLIKKGYIVVKKIYLTMEDLYEEVYLGEYRGNPNWSSDD